VSAAIEPLLYDAGIGPTAVAALARAADLRLTDAIAADDARATIHVLDPGEPEDVARCFAAGARFAIAGAIAGQCLPRMADLVRDPTTLAALALTSDGCARASPNPPVLDRLIADGFLRADRRGDLDLMLTEAIANVVDHGSYGLGPDEVPAVVVALQVHGEELMVSVEQSGIGPSSPDDLLAQANRPQAPPAVWEGGRGLFLIAKLASEMHFSDEGRRLVFAMPVPR
jgi:anti-sigma regulatory factor (Ser/Thr protein kinase)